MDHLACRICENMPSFVVHTWRLLCRHLPFCRVAHTGVPRFPKTFPSSDPLFSVWVSHVQSWRPLACVHVLVILPLLALCNLDFFLGMSKKPGWEYLGYALGREGLRRVEESFRRVTSSYPWLSPVAGRPAAGQAPGRKRTCWSSRCPPSAGSPARRATSRSQISSPSYHRFRPQMQGRCYEIYFRGGKLYCEFYQSKYTIRVLASFFEQCEKWNQFGRYRGYSMGGLSVKDALQVLPPLKRGGGHIIAQNIFLYLHVYQVPQECLFLWDCYEHRHWVFYILVKQILT